MGGQGGRSGSPRSRKAPSIKTSPNTVDSGPCSDPPQFTEPIACRHRFSLSHPESRALPTSATRSWGWPGAAQGQTCRHRWRMRSAARARTRGPSRRRVSTGTGQWKCRTEANSGQFIFGSRRMNLSALVLPLRAPDCGNVHKLPWAMVNPRHKDGRPTPFRSNPRSLLDKYRICSTEVLRVLTFPGIFLRGTPLAAAVSGTCALQHLPHLGAGGLGLEPSTAA